MANDLLGYDLSGFGLGVETKMLALGDLMTNKVVSELHLNMFQAVPDRYLELLACVVATNKSLRRVRLNLSKSMSAAQLVRFCAGFGENTTITHLDLCFTNVSGGWAPLFQALASNTTVAILNMNCTGFCAADMSALLSLLEKNRTIVRLGLSFNDLGGSDIDTLADWLETRRNTAVLHIECFGHWEGYRPPKPDSLKRIECALAINRAFAYAFASTSASAYAASPAPSI